MTSLTIHIDHVTERRLRTIAAELQRDVHDLAECAVAEAVLDYFRGRPAVEESDARLNKDTIQ